LIERENPRVYVVVRNRNEAAHLERLIRALELQTWRPGLVLVDNESTDDSVAVASRYGARIVKISRDEFSFGRAINVGVEAAPAEFIVLLSSHSLPLTSTFIEDCLRPFDDPDVAAVKCLKLIVCERWMNPKVLRGPVNWDDIRVQDLLENNGSVFRKSVWSKFPFDETLEASEDRLWSFQVLNAGYAIAHSAALYKYCHKDRFWARLRRFTREHTALHRMGARRNNPYPVSRVLADVFYRLPREYLATTLYTMLRFLAFQTVSWKARRKGRLGSVR
jgi:glycosyltransferase involved in cell wall biosynthesis